MSVIARVQTREGTHVHVLTKGSPEVVAALVAPATLPAWYAARHAALTKQGMRVIALASRRVTEPLTDRQLADKPRAWAEAGLAFVGFVAFRCLVRKDSRETIEDLQDSAHKVVMITGDAVLTGTDRCGRAGRRQGGRSRSPSSTTAAIHVATEVNICRPNKREILVLQDRELLEASGAEDLAAAAAASPSAAPPLAAAPLTAARFFWQNAATDAVEGPLDVSPVVLQALAATRDLCVTGAVLGAALTANPALRASLECFSVYARMTPDRKEQVLVALKEHGHHTLMCGDGANDVGALKQAHVGIALLSGFGSANVDKDGGTRWFLF